MQPTVAETAPAAKPNSAVDAAIGGAVSVGHSAQPKGGGVSSAPPAAAASFADSGGGMSASSYALTLLAIVVLSLIAAYANVRIRRRRQRRRLEAFWREEDVAWEAALRRVELGQVPGASEPSARPLQRIKVG